MKRWIHASKELIAPWNDPEVKYICNTNGYQCYRKVVDGKGKWFAHKQEEPIETMVPITYNQARGYEPMPNESSISKLQRELGELLLPPEGGVHASKEIKASWYDDEPEDTEGWVKMDRKWVDDFDGFSTDYTLWYNELTDEWCTVFGDCDLYHPWDSDHDMDFENNEREARDWFENYTTDDLPD